MTPAPKVTGHDLSQKLAEEIEAVVRELKVSIERVTRRKIYAFAPWDNAKKAKLEIELEKPPGKWNDWLGGNYGDALGLVACILSGNGGAGRDKAAVKVAIQWAKERYGLGGEFDGERWEQEKIERERRAKEREAKTARELNAMRTTAKGLWLAALPLSRTDPAGMYLGARGISLSDFARAPRAARYSPACRYYEDGEVTHVGPAILVAMTLHDGKFGSLHRTWINPMRPGEKADLPTYRKMWPSSEGAAMRLWRGASGKSEADAAKAGIEEDVIACEGFEDGLSIALLTPEKRVHAVGSLPGLLSYVPPKCARRLIVAADNDWGKPQAEALLNRACKRIEVEFKLPVFIARSPVGKDYNDLLRGA